MKKVLIFLFFCLSTFALVDLKIAKTIPATNLNSKSIFIDPGHGGPDGGTESNCNIYEKDIVLDISKYLKDLFVGAGFKVYLTRDGDYDLASENSQNRKREDIRKRVQLINESDAFLYLSIHANNYPNASIHGAQVFYSSNKPASQTLSKYIQSSFVMGLNNTKREAMVIKDKYLLDHVNKVGSLIEVGFLSNPEELALLKTNDYKMKIAMVIYFGVLDFLENNN